jgi:metallo-beta-lactamase family protein
MKLTSFGGVETVTGSQHLLEIGACQYLVDCGLFQGDPELSQLNKIEIDRYKGIKAIFLTHAHIDHAGLIAALFAKGLILPIYCTQATFDLLKIMLVDAANIQLQQYKNTVKKTNQKIKLIPKPLYNQEDVVKVFANIKVVHYNESFTLNNDTVVTYFPAGHIIGASSIRFECQHQSILFSGDLGRYNDILMRSPEVHLKNDFIVCESTYGDRNHPSIEYIEELAEIIRDHKNRKGLMIIASFAVARTQNLIYALDQVFKRYPDLTTKILLDSPMAIKVCDVYTQHNDEVSIDKKTWLSALDRVIKIEHSTQRADLNKNPQNKILITSSGMLTGGRVIEYVKNHIHYKENTLLLAGYQAEQTLGHEIANGAQKVIIEKTKRDVNAKVFKLESFSSHADLKDLKKWLDSVARIDSKIYLSHGEDETLNAFKLHLADQFSNITILERDKTYLLSK